MSSPNRLTVKHRLSYGRFECSTSLKGQRYLIFLNSHLPEPRLKPVIHQRAQLTFRRYVRPTFNERIFTQAPPAHPTNTSRLQQRIPIRVTQKLTRNGSVCAVAETAHSWTLHDKLARIIAGSSRQLPAEHLDAYIRFYVEHHPTFGFSRRLEFLTFLKALSHTLATSGHIYVAATGSQH